MARIAGIWTSPGRKSGRSVGHERAQAIAGQGIEGCAHANPPKREVLFASLDHLRSVGVEPGAIRENLTVEGDDVQQWPIGQHVKVGDALFEITMVCDPCHRMDELRQGLRAELDGKRGMLARVVESGEVAVGDPVEPRLACKPSACNSSARAGAFSACLPKNSHGWGLSPVVTF